MNFLCLLLGHRWHIDHWYFDLDSTDDYRVEQCARCRKRRAINEDES